MHDNLKFAALAYRLLEDILDYADSPAQMNRRLVEQLRDLTGARLVVLARRRQTADSHQLVAFAPERRRQSAESPAMMVLAGRARDLDGPALWESEDIPPEAAALLHESLPGPTAALPLRVGGQYMGALLFFGLPREQSRDQALAALGALSRVVALVLRNAILYEDQEAAIASHRRELAESQERLQITLRSIGDAVITTDLQGRVTFINPVAEQLTGWGEAEAQGRPLAEVFAIVNEQTRQPVENPVARVLREGTVIGLANHTLLIARDGAEAPIADSGAPIRDAQGKITGVVLVFRDQSEERAAQNALIESEERFRNIVESSPMGMHMYRLESDDRLVFVGANHAADQILGVDNSQFIGKTIEEAFPPLAATEVPMRYRRAAAQGESWATEQIAYADEKIAGAFEVHAFQTEPGKMVALFLDITERKRAEEQLRHTMEQLDASEKHLKTIIETEPECVKILAPNGALLEMNRAGLDMIEADSLAQVQGQPVLSLVAPEYWQAFRAMLANVMRGNSETLVFEIIGLKGTHRWLETHSVPLYDAENKITGLMGVTRDITARKRTEATWQALNTAAVALQRAAPHEVEIYRAASEQLAALGLRGGITLLDKATNTFVFEHLFIPPRLLTALERLTGLTGAGYRVPRARVPVFAQAVESGQALYVTNSATQIVAKLLPESISRLTDQVAEMLGPANAILAPLKVKDRVGGLLCVVADWLRAADAPAITAFADQMSAALENARLYEETQQLATFNQNIIQSMAEGIVVQDADGVCTFANPAAATMLGYAPDELVGLHWTAITPPDQQSIIQRADERRRRGESDRYELELVGKDGKRIVALVSGVPRFDRQGQFVGTMGVFTDISQRVRMEETLKASESKYKALFEGIDDAILVHPFVEEGFLNFIEVNEVACRRLGYSREELLNLSAADISAPEDVLLRGSRKGKEPLLKDKRMVFEAVHLTKSGKRIPVEISSSRFELEGQSVVISVARDITQRKQAEERISRLLDRQMAINRMGLLLGNTLDLPTICRIAHQEIQKIMDSPNFGVSLYDEARQEITPLFLIGDGQPLDVDDLPAAPLEPETGPQSRTIVTRQADIVADLVDELPRIETRIVAPTQDPRRARSILTVPMIIDERVIGTMQVQSYQAGVYSPADAELLSGIANQVALAIQNARLFEEIQQHAVVLEERVA